MDQFRKLEFGVASGIALLLLFGLLYPSIIYNVFELQQIYGHKFARYNQVFDYYIHYLLPAMARIIFVYSGFLMLNFVIVPRFLEQKKWWTGILLLLLTGLIFFLGMMVAGSYYNGYLFGVYDTVQGAHTHFAKSAFITTIFCGVLYVVYYYLRNAYFDYLHQRMLVNAQYRKIAREVLIFSGILLAMMALVFSDSRDAFWLMFFFGPVIISVAFILFYKIIPDFKAVHHNKRLFIRDVILLILGANFLMAMVVRAVHHGGVGMLGPILTFGVLICAGIVLPVTWFFYQSRQKQVVTVKKLQTALGHSTANLDFLRAQINPHFLFNALNTLYGTALQEEAPRTSEGIQKLGDMMRFMLHDNHLTKIPLDKEVAYLQNYIDLQRLRVMSSPDILIEVNIDDSQCQHEIAPMLLIPFVENAFKHGISLRHRSRIVISLSCNSEQLFFDVYNSVHQRPENDPERDSMGIGLNNVKERLALLYPNRHELSIRHTTSEFFVHLTIDVKD
ncbi:Histidine kinase [Chitinophaga eiseniae]|uniref:Histidine kinase n=1 Tax=Chitinophaga eiseniae TaxID=634771 RepID=A0A1T4TJY5_9BACT|nr:histidine kinase [Chitinophaga eiseniae]SKA40765.1 Histidine kinase [Chitinophaga eiseniae]